MSVNLTGPFSPFATALRNIRDNLVSRQTGVTFKDFQKEYLLATITISVPLPNSPQSTLEFPVAACWLSKRPEQIALHYSGEYADVEKISKGEEREKISLIRRNILERIEQIIDGEETEGLFEEFPFAGEPTDYPESLRWIQGYWLFRVPTRDSELTFLIFISPNDRSIDNRRNLLMIGGTGCEPIHKAFEDFYAEGIRGLKYLVEGHAPASVQRSLDLSYPGLRNILSGIVVELDKLGGRKALRPRKSTLIPDEPDLRSVFRIIFVRPVVMENGAVGFRYILTHQQIDYLKRQTAESTSRLAGEGENSAYRKLSREFEGIKKALGGSRDSLPRRLSRLGKIKDFEGLGATIKSISRQNLYLNSGALDEFLRKCIYVYYAFSKRSKEDLSNKSGDLVDALEEGEGDVTPEQAFLIAQIFDSGRPDIIRNFINHPFSKYLQHPTEELIEIFNQDFYGGGFYPPFLHLFETIALPERLFMYPVYQYDSPLLLSACDANYYAMIQTNFKSILDRNTQGIFGSILGFELAETNNLLTKTVEKIAAGEERWESTLSGLIEQRFRQLTLHFCLNAVDADSKNTDIKLGEVKEPGDGANPQIDRKGAKVLISGLDKEVTIKHRRGKKIITTSPESLSVFGLYLQLTANIFARYFEIRNLITGIARIEVALKQRKEQYEVQAHEIRKVTSSIAGESPAFVLGQIRLYFNTLFGITVDALVERRKEGFPPDYAAGHNLRDFARNAMRVAARLDVIISWTDSGNVQHDESELEEAAQIEVDRLRFEGPIGEFIIPAGTDKTRWSFFAALVCGLRNVLKHSPRNSIIRIRVRERTGFIVILNEAIWFMRGDGQKRRERLSPGQTQEAIDFYVSLYGIETKKAVMHWNRHIKLYVTKIPYPTILFEANE